MFNAILPELCKDREVITVDLQGHGRTADINRPLSYEAMADDIAGLIRYLKIGPADVMGYSVGGEVALRTAIQHPDVVRKLVIVSATYRRDGWYPEIVAQESHLDAQAAAQMKQTPFYQTYAHIAPHPQDWPILCTKLGTMFRQDYDWSSDVAKIRMPVLLVFGDADAVRTSNAVYLIRGQTVNSNAPALGGGGAWIEVPVFRFLSADVVAFDLPHDDFTAGAQDGGTPFAAFAGPKAGFHLNRFGVFVKARPGFTRFSRTESGLTLTSEGQIFVVNHPQYQFSLDTGSVFEYTPARHAQLRREAGDDLIFYHAHSVAYSYPGQQGIATVAAAHASSMLFLVGAGWRF
jgi:esterase/lipase